MPRVPCLLLLLALVALLVPGGALAQPANDEPDKPGPDKPADPSKPPPIIEKPADGEGGEEEPPEEPVAPTEPQGRLAEQKTYEHPAGLTAAGMCYVPAGTAVIGTTFERLMKDLLRGRPEAIKKDFAFEVPQHTRPMPGFFVDQFEVTNAQYLVFLQKTAPASYDTDEATLGNLEEVSGELMRLPRDKWKEDDVSWRQLYRWPANKKQLWEKMPNRIKRNPAGEVLERETEDSFHYAPLVRGMKLEFYSRKPPETWPDLEPLPVLRDHPVASVSYDDAEAFAEWAGKHIPTEFEWEYAGRGPEGYYWPWGDRWYDDATHANWGGKVRGLELPEEVQAQLDPNQKYMPITLPSTSLPEGRSWCGIHNMLGNVAEWTSSWFQPYPGNDNEHIFMGEFVKVLRGASHKDEDPLALRLAARNFVGAGVKAPPRPGNRFALVGFRCAWYEEPGRDQLDPILRRVARGRRVTSESVVLDHYAGATAVQWAAKDEAVENGVYVRDHGHAIVLLPLKQALPDSAKEPKIKNRKQLIDESEEMDDPLPLAVFHTDVALAKVQVRAAPGAGGERGERGGRGSKKKVGPAVTDGTCPPGTYLLAVWFGKPCLTLNSLEFVCFLTKDEAKTGQLDVKSVKPEDLDPSGLVLEPDLDVAFLSLQVPIGGANNGKDTTVVIKTIELNFAKGELSAAGDWRMRE